MWTLISACLQHVIPHHLLCALMYRAARYSWRPWKNALIRLFVKKYEVDLEQAQRSSVHDYLSFNDFFTRALKPGLRPVTKTADGLISPVDGTVSAAGVIEDTRLLQAKGRGYSLAELLHDERDLLGCFSGGNFITLYLSPRDYHRVHCPIDGELQSMAYVPGRLFSVNAGSVQRIGRLFARNERVIVTFRTAIGMVSVIFVGAIFVGSVATVWHGEVTPAGRRDYFCRRYEPGTVFRQGEEIGRFNMGSTVILLTEPDRVAWKVMDGQVVMGEEIGSKKVFSFASRDK